MRNLTWFMCMLAVVALGFAGVVSAQQQSLDSGSPLDQSKLQSPQIQQPAATADLPPHQDQQAPPRQPQDRSLLRNNHQSTAGQTVEAGQGEQTTELARGELGVWLAAIEGPGLA